MAKNVRKIAQEVADKKRAGILIWQNIAADNDLHGEIWGQGDPFDMFQFAILAVELFAVAYGLPPEKAAEGISSFFKAEVYKPTTFKADFVTIRRD